MDGRCWNSVFIRYKTNFSQGLEIDPCIPNDWDSYSVSRIYRGVLYKITISNPENRSKGVKQIYVNEKLIDGTTIEPLKLSNEVNVKVIMG